MEIPLVLHLKADGSFRYGMPRLFRVVMLVILLALGYGLYFDSRGPGTGGYIVLVVVLLATLYVDGWSYNPKKQVLVRSVGIWPITKRESLSRDSLGRFCIEAFVRGTVPGSQDEAAENRAALSGARADDGGKRRALHKRPYLCLVCETVEGKRYFINAVPARRGAKLKSQAAEMAKACGVQVFTASDTRA